MHTEIFLITARRNGQTVRLPIRGRESYNATVNDLMDLGFDLETMPYPLEVYNSAADAVHSALVCTGGFDGADEADRREIGQILKDALAAHS